MAAINSLQKIRDLGFNGWQKISSGSIGRKIFGAILTVGVLSLLSRAATVARELVFAWKFGTGDVLDAFFIAWVVTSFLVNLIAGSFNAAFIPTYIRVREEEGAAAAQRLFAGTSAWSLGLLGVTALLSVLLAPLYLPLIAGGFAPDKLQLTFRLLALLAPVVVLSGLITMWSALLNADERFALASAASILTPICGILLFLIVPAWGISALALGTSLGALLEAIVLGVALQRAGISLLPRWQGFDPHLRSVAGQYVPMIVGSFLMSSTLLVDGAMAAALPAGSVAALNFGNRVVGLVVGLGTVALGTAVTPYFSSLMAREDWAALRYTLGRCVVMVLAGTIPLTLLLIIGARPMIQLLFERGSFTARDTQEVAHIHTLFALQIPFYCAGIPMVRAISALRANHILMWACALNLVVNVVLNLVFMRWWGVAGIALSTSAVYLVSFSFCWFMFNMQIKSILKQGLA